ncbi:alpha/beta hydrolase [Schaedlerella arabinosiphila]|uniref:Alpha/beta hydrolase n=1 Tax=Schaedlerella arabinosiphila TaxID=2044587 RepID=A0A426DE08_9FIRM|nr:alpha/beta hydrolase [Schaedlerella arabinosiphila]MDE7066576.1 alpha/beta hydrolase [Schaedlerella arabinosiphila]RRK30968.1 alpha/beta hydrolase [Schaedlerella arabinosiphila]
MQSNVIYLYDDRKDVTLTTYILQDSPELLNGKDRPAVIICPGGGYFNCSDREAEPIALKFASMGYHAFVLRYSTYCEGTGAFPDLSKPLTAKAHCQNPVPVREIGQAMLIVREHAREWLVDVDRIAVCGFSAGAHNAAMYAANWHTDMISGHFGKEKELFRPAAAILGYMLSDYIYMKEAVKDASPMDQAFFAASNTAFLGEAEPSDEVLAAVSPARNVTEHMPPVFLWATAEDELVPVQHSIRMAHALADKKIPFELHIFEEGPHGLALSDQSSAESLSQVYPDAAKWADLAGAWLKKRFALPLPEKSSFEKLLENGGI